MQTGGMQTICLNSSSSGCSDLFSSTADISNLVSVGLLTGAGRIVCGEGFMQLPDVRQSVRLSVCPFRPLHPAAVGLLLWARRPGDIDRLLHGRRSAAAAPQQMRAVPRRQPTYAAEHAFVHSGPAGWRAAY